MGRNPCFLLGKKRNFIFKYCFLRQCTAKYSNIGGTYLEQIFVKLENLTDTLKDIGLMEILVI